MHGYGGRCADGSEHNAEHRHHDDATADTEQASQQAGDGTAGEQRQKQVGKLMHADDSGPVAAVAQHNDLRRAGGCRPVCSHGLPAAVAGGQCILFRRTIDRATP